LNSQEQSNFQDNEDVCGSPGLNRREVFSNSAKALFAGLATPLLLDPTDPANALLLRFPVDAPNTQPLKNKYHFMRAGTSDLEAEGIYSTNPLFLTNRDNGISDQGYDSLKEAIAELKKTPCQPTVAYHSLAANGMDTGDLIARELKLGRDRLLPEFTYLDQRGIGLWDSNEEAKIRPAIWAMDVMEAGTEGFGGRPPANTDGTPNDTLHDQFTRLRQFLSLQETRTSGEIILVIFPDGTGPALMSCMIAGIPYSEAHALEYKPGELRLDITTESIREMYETRKNDPTYLATIEEGKEKLKELREMKAKDFSVSFKDSQYEMQQEAESQAFYAKQKAEATIRQKAEDERRAAIQEQIRVSKEKAEAKKEERRQVELAIKEKKNQKLREEKELADKKRALQQAAFMEKKQKQTDSQVAAKQKYAESQAVSKQKYAESQTAKKQKQLQTTSSKSAGTTSEPSEVSLPFGLSPVVLATAAVGAIGAVFLSGTEDDEETNNDYSAVTTKKVDSGGNGNAATETPSISTAVHEEKPKSDTAAKLVTSDKIEEPKQKEQSHTQPLHTVATTKKEAQSAVEVTNVTQEETKKKKKPKFKPLHSMNKSDSGDDDNSTKTRTTSISAAVHKETPQTETTAPASTTDASAKKDEVVPKEDGSAVDASSSKTKEDEFTTKMQAAEQEMKDALVEAGDVKKKKHQQQHHQAQKPPPAPTKKSSLFDNDPPVVVTNKITKTTNFVYDDDEDDSDWLRVLGEIREETEEDEDDLGKVDDTAALVNDAQP
jgi:broad specificity phosphatase PhoE